MRKKNILLILFILLLAGALLFLRFGKLNKPEQAITDLPTDDEANLSMQIPASTLYVPKQYDLDQRLIGLSDEQLNQHKTLYEGYVKKRNQIMHDLKTADRAERNRTYTPYRELKVEETYAVNGQLLHELYFENMGPKNASIGPLMKQLVNENFGSIDAFKNDFMASGGVARGWVVTAYGLDDGKLHNYVLEAHNQNVPVLAIPLLVLDVYEHAYMIDYGIKRDPYLDLFWNHIDWNVVEERINNWVKPLQKSIITKDQID